MKPKSSCPHCGKKDCFAEVAAWNAESYGGGSYKMLCERCQKPIVVYLSRIVVIEGIEKRKS